MKIMIEIEQHVLTPSGARSAFVSYWFVLIISVKCCNVLSSLVPCLISDRDMALGAAWVMRKLM